MHSEYQPVYNEDEKYRDIANANRLSISTSDSTLLYDDVPEVSKQTKLSSSWIWLVHAFLLSLSFTMFALAYFNPVSTLDCVQRFSAYCEFLLFLDYSIINSKFCSSCSRSGGVSEVQV